MGTVLEEKKTVETLEKLSEILLSVIIIVIRMCGALILYDIVIVPVFGAPPVTFW